MKTIDNIPVWGDPVDDGAMMQIKECSKTAHKVAMMADHHKGYSVPIGGVVAYINQISPSGVGYDIGCGNKAVLTDKTIDDIAPHIKGIMDDVFSKVSFGIGQHNNIVAYPDHELYNDEAWNLDAASGLKDNSVRQLGTVGSGNHYVDILCDENGHIWIGVHFGSRGLGHKIATWFFKKCDVKDSMDCSPLVLDVDSQLGQEYIACMQLAGKYAYAGRDWVCDKVASILGARILSSVHNHHNYAWKEIHDGEELWVVRKGATPAFPGQQGFIGGSMGDISVIIEGKEHEMSNLSLYSTVHGAGRVMGRMQAKGKYNRKTGECIRAGLVTKEMMGDWISKYGVELRGAGVDESPHCYKRIVDVLKAHSDSIDILHTLTPIGVAMAGEKDFDPYKD
jgi:tRNA-splicing ligase RtcB (3'-phosphate/5'-hydroxy nucleic acid ligase)